MRPYAAICIDYYLPAGHAGIAGCWFDLSAGTVDTLEANADSAGIKDIGDGWYRCHVVVTTTADTAIIFGIYPDDNTNTNHNVDLDGTSSIFIWTIAIANSMINKTKQFKNKSVYGTKEP